MVAVVVASGGGAAVVFTTIIEKAVAAVAAAQAAAAAAAQAAALAAASEAALAAAIAAEAAGALVAAEAALAAAIAAEAAAATAAGVAATNFWNPLGWAIGAVLVGASQPTSRTVTWGCYKPIIGEVDTKETSIKPITFADLAAHPEVRRVFIHTSTTSANLPEVEVENKAGQRYLLRGVVLPWGSVAYHAERTDD